MDKDILSFFALGLVWIILILIFKKSRRKKENVRFWAGSFVVSLGLGGMIANYNNLNTYLIMAGLFFVIIGLGIWGAFSPKRIKEFFYE